MKYTSNSLEETREIAEDFAATLKPAAQAVVIALVGDLGAGKTAFSQFMGEAFGVRDAIQSPTYLIEKIYELHKLPWQHLVHIDAYRLESESELISLGWNDIIARPENIILVEWADKILGLLPEGTIRVTLRHLDETSREIEIEEKGGE